jgi:hypothetical protein
LITVVLLIVRYAAVYMMYAMYFKQPCMPRVKFRLKPEEFRDMWALMEEAQRDHHYDVLYAWAKVEDQGCGSALS